MPEVPRGMDPFGIELRLAIRQCAPGQLCVDLASLSVEPVAYVTRDAVVLRQLRLHRSNRRLDRGGWLSTRRLHDPAQLDEEGLLILNNRPLPEGTVAGTDGDGAKRGHLVQRLDPRAGVAVAEEVVGAVHDSVTSKENA